MLKTIAPTPTLARDEDDDDRAATTAAALAAAAASSSSLARVFTDDDDHELVQRRLGLLYGVLGAIVIAVFVVGVVAMLIALPSRFWEVHLSTMKIMHIVLGLALSAFAIFCRRSKLLSRSILAAFDLVGAFTVMATTGVMIVTSPFGIHGEFLAMIPLMVVVCLRAALVPSSPRWTLLVATVASIPGPITTWLVSRTTGASDDFARLDIVFAITWAGAGIASAFAIAKVIYGLRAEVKKAMRLGQYTLADKIGEGGMGVVYRARHALLRRPTAIKLLSSDRVGSVHDIKRFEREVQLTSLLTHPNTIAVYDFGHTHDGVFYYAMEHLDGMSLHDLVAQHGPQPAARVIRILEQVSGALAEAHGIGLVHRDVKPANIFLCERGGIADFVKVLDFGLVKLAGKSDGALSVAGAIAGTPHYMAPESITDPESVDARVDIYALGCVGYYLLTGATPFEGSNLVEICSHHLHTAPEPPNKRLGLKPDAHDAIGSDVEALIMKCLAKSKDARPKSAAVLLFGLAKCEARSAWDVEKASAWWREHAKTKPKGQIA